jgi:predicted NUDIX family NTP pyrophosphohydrolase
MAKKSAGILIYRKIDGEYEVLLVHPGGPFWAKKDLNSWSVPKGEFEDDEEPLAAAKREFEEETGIAVTGEFIELEPVKQLSGKIIYTWATEGDPDISNIKSNLFELEWPPKSGNFKEFPEVDRAGWFTFDMAEEKIITGQIPILKSLRNRI